MRTKWLPLCLLLSSLLPNSATAQSSNTQRNVRGGADESAALSHSEFTKPKTLHIDSDGFLQARRLEALNGVSSFNVASDLNPSGGPNDFRPCAEQVTNGSPPEVGAYVVGYNFDPRTIAEWLLKNQFIQFETYSIRYPKTEAINASGSFGEGFKAAAVFVCAILNDNVGKYLPSNQARDVHNGLDIPIGRRALTKWTFRNRYDTPVPGKGTVKVFAGTFSYRIHPIVPIVAFPGEGTATVKLYLNPDNGRWTVDNWQMQDPGITLLTNPLPVNCKVFTITQDNSRLVSPYKGGCKDGLADGHGSYTLSVYRGGVPKPLNVNGEFRNGKLNGKVAMTGADSEEGEYRENERVNSILRSVLPTGRIEANEWRNGVFFSRCTSDGQDERNCTDRDKLLETH
jgi:hypothetical protein